MSGAGSDAALETADERAARLRRGRDTATVVRQRLRVRAENLRGWARGFLGVLTAVLIAGGLGFALAGKLAQRDILSQIDTTLAPLKATLKNQKDQLPKIEQDLKRIKTNILEAVQNFATFESAQIPASIVNKLSLHSIFFVDNQNGWAVGNEGVILATSDGGTTWKKQDAQATGYLDSVYFVSRTVGWVVGSEGIIRATTDGGKTWHKTDSDTTSYLHGVQFVTSNQGWAVGSDGTILETSDAGKKWTKVKISTSRDLQSVQFLTANQGWVVGEAGTILTTTDAGKTWNEGQTGEFSDLSSVQFISPTQGWACGGGRTIFATTDGGKSWRQRDLRTASLSSLYFLSSTQGWAVGDAGTILSTDDGGATWQKREVNTTEDFTGLRFLDPMQGWAVGINGTILKIKRLSTADFVAADTADEMITAAQNHLIADDFLTHFSLANYADKYEEHERLEANIRQLQDQIGSSNTPTVSRAHGGDPEAAKFAIGELFQTNNFALFLIRLGISAFVFFFVGFIITVYRYLMRLAAHYDACADALELCEDPLDAGFSSLVAVLSPASISFGKEPRSIIDHAFGAAQGVAGLTKGRE